MLTLPNTIYFLYFTSEITLNKFATLVYFLSEYNYNYRQLTHKIANNLYSGSSVNPNLSPNFKSFKEPKN
jgi:hypothetical protein